jgi:hypothetical protein
MSHLGAPVDRETLCLPGGYPAVKDVHVGQTRAAQRHFGLHGALPRAAHKDDVPFEVLDDLVAVLAQQVERNVVGAGNVHRVELAGGSDVQHSRGHCQIQKRAQILRVDRGVHEALSFDGDALALGVQYPWGYSDGHITHTPSGIRKRE